MQQYFYICATNKPILINKRANQNIDTPQTELIQTNVLQPTLSSSIRRYQTMLDLLFLCVGIAVNQRILQFDQWVMVGSAILQLLFLLSGRRVNRAESALLLIGYSVYIVLSFTLFVG
ncbi:hypothetical protein [Catenovulum maritimum]|uniref:Uncharacterized protein n=1 Tax=Catenovulum maritimum TaxID=1513271 RepID=A0A0J8H207_9ALTE|nr:hypothetical protein [Catenovulum maritimum]KMT67053.1 hypothetical protein XM47_00175 [Catenovulum maritimum]